MIEAHRWQKNGDHPEDNCRVITPSPYDSTNDGDRHQQFWSEGRIVRYYRTPDIDGTMECPLCGFTMHLHGWIESEHSVGIGAHGGLGTVVCPGNMIVSRGLGLSDTPRYEVVGYPQFHRRYRQIGFWPTCCYVEVGTHVWESEHPKRVAVSHWWRTLQARIDHRRLLLNLKVADHMPWRLKSAVIIAETSRFSQENPQAEVPAISAVELIRAH